MKSFLHYGFALTLWLASYSGQAQECTNFQFWVSNQAGENFPVLNVNYLISNANGMPTANGTWEVTPNGIAAEFCLSVGCYTIAISGDGVTGESVGIELFQSDFVQILELSPGEGEGVWDATFCIEQGQQFNCPDAIDYAAGEGCSWAFEIGSFQEGEEVMWNFGDGTEPFWGGHFIEHEFPASGTYQINAFFTSFDCPMGVELQTTVEVTGCGDADCELEMEVSTEDGMWYTFTIPEQPEGAIIEWYINGQVVPPTSENGLTFEAGFDFNPNWTVCVEVFTDACPEGAEACYSNLETDCPEGISVDSEGCHYVFSIGNLDNQEIGWSIDGEFIEWSNYAFDWYFETGGWHVIQAVYYSANCPGETYAIEVNTEGCGDGEGCDLELAWNEIECDYFFIEALNQPEGATLYWTLDGEPYEYGFAEMTFTFEEDGCHVFGVGYETPDCPQGAFAEVEICSDCTGMGCDVSIVYDELADGIYLFSAVTASGELYGGEIHWWTGGSNVGSGNPFAWTWDTEEPMEVGMCIGYQSWQDCPGGETCIELETPGMACEEIQLVINGDWTADVEWAFELGFEAFIDGFEIAGWSFEDAWSAEGSLSDTLNLCVPPACFDVFWGWDAANVNVEELLVAVLLAQGDPITLFDWFGSNDEANFGLLPDCFDEVWVSESHDPVHVVWPNPTAGALNWQIEEAKWGSPIVIYSVDGREMHRQALMQSTGTLDVSEWPNGYYVIRWTNTDGRPLQGKVMVLH